MEVWQRTLRVLWLVQFLTTLAMNLGLTFVPFFLSEDPVLRVEDESARAIYTGLILAGPFFTTIVFTPFWGWVADRTGPKRQVVRASFGLAASQFLMAIAQSPMQMVAIRAFQGIVSGVLAANLALLAVVTPSEKQGRAIAILQSSTPVGQVFGPVFGGLLALQFGFRATYYLLSTVILVTGLVAWKLLKQEGFVPSNRPNPFRSLYEGAKRAWGSAPLRQAFVVLAAAQFAFTMAQGVFAIFAERVIVNWRTELGISATWWTTGIGFTAVAMTVTGMASALSSPTWGRFHDQQRAYLTPIGTALLSMAMLLMTAWPVWWVILISRLFVGIGAGATSTLQYAFISSSSVPSERGQMMGLATAVMHLGNLLGFALGGILASWWTESGNFLLSAMVYASVTVAALRLELRHRRLRLSAAAAVRVSDPQTSDLPVRGEQTLASPGHT